MNLKSGGVLIWICLCNSVSSVSSVSSVVIYTCKFVNHGDTEDTEVARRRTQTKTLPEIESQVLIINSFCDFLSLFVANE